MTHYRFIDKKGNVNMENMKSNQDVPWQQSEGSLLFLLILLSVAVVWVIAISWAPAVAGGQGAVENLVTTFAYVAVALSGLAAGYKQPKLVTVGAPVWTVTFYFSSLILGDMIQGHNVGTLIRVGAISALAFVLALSYLHRKRKS